MTTSTSKEVSPNDCENDRQPEIAIWPPKPEILISYISGTIIDTVASKFKRQFCGFQPCRVQIKYFRFRRHISISGCRSLSQSFGDTFFLLSKTPLLPLEFRRYIHHISRNKSTFGFGRCRSQSLSLNSPWSNTQTHLLFFYLNSWGFLPQGQHVCVKEAQYEG